MLTFGVMIGGDLVYLEYVESFRMFQTGTGKSEFFENFSEKSLPLTLKTPIQRDP